MALQIKIPQHAPDKVSAVQRHWLWQVTALALFLGAILGASLRAQQNFKAHNIFPNRNGVPPVEYARQVKRNNDLQAEITQLNEDKKRLVESISGGASLGTLKQELDDAKRFAGLSAVTGPGVEVTLSDVPKAKVKGLGVAEEETYIHDVDILQVVNELRAAGAEAISINEQRLSATSPIRCVGNSVLINTTPVGVPLKIRALGDVNTLYSGMRMTGGVMDGSASRLALLGMISIDKDYNMELPAYAGVTALKHVKTK